MIFYLAAHIAHLFAKSFALCARSISMHDCTCCCGDDQIRRPGIFCDKFMLFVLNKIAIAIRSISIDNIHLQDTFSVS